jgi:hypothetical protein
MNPVERACVNGLIEVALENWNTLRDGDLVSMVHKLNAVIAIALRGMRGEDKKPA